MYAEAYRRRAQARETRRLERHAALRDQAARMATVLRERYGSRARIFLFGSLLEPDFFSDRSDIDLAVEGLSATEYWEAWALVEPYASGVDLDLVRVESASKDLREVILDRGEELP